MPSLHACRASGLMVWGLEFRFWDLVFTVQSLGLGFRVSNSGFRVLHLRV